MVNGSNLLCYVKLLDYLGLILAFCGGVKLSVPCKITTN